MTRSSSSAGRLEDVSQFHAFTRPAVRGVLFGPLLGLICARFLTEPRFLTFSLAGVAPFASLHYITHLRGWLFRSVRQSDLIAGHLVYLLAAYWLVKALDLGETGTVPLVLLDIMFVTLSYALWLLGRCTAGIVGGIADVTSIATLAIAALPAASLLYP